MKKLIGVFFIVLPAFAFGQTTAYGNFKVVDQEIIYQKVFAQDSITVAKLVEYYKTLPYLANVNATADEVTFDMNDIMVDYKKFQFAQNATPLIIQTGKYSGKGSVGVKDGKYRVTVRSIQLTGNIDYKKISQKENLTTYSTINSGTAIHQNWLKPNTLGLLDKAFTDKLQFVDKEKKDNDDW